MDDLNGVRVQADGRFFGVDGCFEFEFCVEIGGGGGEGEVLKGEVFNLMARSEDRDESERGR